MSQSPITPTALDLQRLLWPRSPSAVTTASPGSDSAQGSNFADVLNSIQGTDNSGLSLLKALQNAAGSTNPSGAIQAVLASNSANNDIALLQSLGNGAANFDVTSLLQANQKAKEDALPQILRTSGATTSGSALASSDLASLLQSGAADDASGLLDSSSGDDSLFQDLLGMANIPNSSIL
jgi:hypothetical protein